MRGTLLWTPLVVLCVLGTAQTLGDQSAERCADGAVRVSGALAEERAAACDSAKHALQLLKRCGIAPKRTVHVDIVAEVRHPFNGPIFGTFDKHLDTVLVTRPANVFALARRTPYEMLSSADFYSSLVVHEVVHGVMHQNLKRPGNSHATYEYPAYALQIESLAPAARETFLQSFDPTDLKSDFMFNDPVLFLDPYFFAARAYAHFKAAPDGCGHLRQLLQDDAPFIAPPRL